MAKDRARPFSRKHRRYWIPVTGGMVLIGVINVIIGFASYQKPSDVHERIIADVPYAPGSGRAPAALPAPTGCAPAITARITADMPGATILACAPDRVSVMRADRQIDLELAGAEIRAVSEHLALPDIPRDVMRAFAIAYPRTIPASAIKRTERGGAPVYQLAFPPGRDHTLATLRADGSVVDVK
ncbi:MAG TPA: hypothetical protein VFP84_33235 [Kofleriaceae bacterium]|nr:hypothetical protein [Kofleriaceae bacterium]